MRGVLPCIESSRSGNDRQPQQFGGWERPWRVSDVIHLGFEGGEAHLRLDHVMSQLRSVEDKSCNSRLIDTQIDRLQTNSK